MKRVILGLLTAAFTLSSAPAMADTVLNAVSSARQTTDFSHPADVRAFYRQVRSAAKAECASTHSNSADRRACVSTSVSDAVAALNQPMLNELHATGRIRASKSRQTHDYVNEYATIRLTSEGVDFASPRAVTRFYSDLNTAAEEVCGLEGSVGIERNEARKCVRTTVSGAVASTNQPTLTALHETGNIPSTLYAQAPAIAAPVSAHPLDAPSTAVSVANVDFGNTDSVKGFYADVKTAAEAVCDTGDNAGLAMRDRKVCVDQTLATTVQATNQPLLSELHDTGTIRTTQLAEAPAAVNDTTIVAAASRAPEAPVRTTTVAVADVTAPVAPTEIVTVSEKAETIVTTYEAAPVVTLAEATPAPTPVKSAAPVATNDKPVHVTYPGDATYGMDGQRGAYGPMPVTEAQARGSSGSGKSAWNAVTGVVKSTWRGIKRIFGAD